MDCTVFIRGVYKKCNVTEELLDLLCLNGTMTVQDIFSELKNCMECAGLDWSKLMCQ